MQTLILISNSPISISQLENALASRFSPTLIDDMGLVIEREREGGGVAYARIRPYQDFAAEYDSEDEVPFPIGSQTTGFLVEFNDLSLLKEVAQFVANRDDIAVDDDHGSIILGRQFVSLLQSSSAFPWLPADYDGVSGTVARMKGET